MPSTKNATNRIRKGRREGVPGTGAKASTVRRGVTKSTRSPDDSDLPGELPSNGRRRAAGLVSKRKAQRQPAKAARKGESSRPRGPAARRKPQPKAGKAVKRRGSTVR